MRKTDIMQVAFRKDSFSLKITKFSARFGIFRTGGDSEHRMMNTKASDCSLKLK